MKNVLLFTLLFSCASMLAQESITPEWMWELGRVSLEDVSVTHNKILYSVKHYNVAENKSKSKLYIMDMDGSNVKMIHDHELKYAGAQFHPTQKKITMMAGVLIFDIETKEESTEMSYSTMNLDGTNLEHHFTGPQSYKVSPMGDQVLYNREIKKHKSLSDKYPDLKKANAHVFDDLMYRHWDSWVDDKASNLFIRDLDASSEAKTIAVTDEPFDTPLKPFGGFEQVTWNDNGEYVLYTSKKMNGKDYAVSTNSDIYAYNTVKKTTTNLTADNKGYDMNPVFSPDGTYLVYNSMETPGFEADKNRLMLKQWPDGETIDITKDIDMSADNPAFSPNGRTIYFTGGVEATYQLFAYDMVAKKITQLTKGVHNVYDFIPTSDGVIARIASMTDAHEIFHISTEGKITQLTYVNKELYGKVKKAQVKSKWVKTTDGKDMKVWYILPPDFDPTKKYPTLLYCQGGPQSAVSQFFSYRWNFQLMAAQGYVIVAPNRRGLPSFGREWNDDISGDWGGQPMEDYLTAIDDAINNESYVDKDRVGAIGASYGGYSVYWLAGNHEGRFKSFISHCGLFNLESWYGTTEELFFANHDLGGPYWDESLAEDYKKFSPHTYADNWDTPILVIHGGKDYRVPLAEGIQAFQLAQLKGIKSKFLYFPEEGHWVLSPQNGVVWQNEFFSWLEETLK